MGKIRIKTIGTPEEEQKNQAQAKKRAEAKKHAEKEKVTAPLIANEVKSQIPERRQSQPEIATSSSTPRDDKPKKSMVKKEKGGVTKKTRSEKYKTAAKLVDKNKTYSLKDALELLPKLKIATFDETVELHINTVETGISGIIILPHGSGKQVRVTIADDSIIEDILKGKIDFDILIATPAMMPKLAKVAKILGPKGLMPNPKNGTITANPEEAAKKFAGGQMRYKTEAKNPIMHLIVGKTSFGEKKLAENIGAMLKAIDIAKMKKVTLKSTMSPAIKIDFTTIK